MKIQSRDNRRSVSKEPQNSSENGKKQKMHLGFKRENPKKGIESLCFFMLNDS